MKKHCFFEYVFLPVLPAALLSWNAGAAAAFDGGSPPAADVLPKLEAGNIRIPFAANEGQIPDSTVKFAAGTFGGSVHVRENGEILYFFPKYETVSDAPATAADAIPKRRKLSAVAAIKERLLGAAAAAPAGAQPAETKINYFVGDSSRWRRDVAAYNAVDMGMVYDGIDFQLRAYGKNIEKLFFVAPGADPGLIRLELEGAERVTLNEAGELDVATALGAVRFSAPVAYQERNGVRVNVDVAYDIQGNTFGFALGEYDPRLPLVIDPLLGSTFLGGIEDDVATAVAIDEEGYNIFLAGYTASADFPQGSNAAPYSATYNGGALDAFVASFNPRLSTLNAVTFLGGSGEDAVYGMAFYAPVVVVAGYTTSTNFPTTGTAYDRTYNGGGDAFITVFTRSLSSLYASTYIGGNSNDCATAVAVGGDMRVAVAGYTSSTNFPTFGIGGTPLSNALKGPTDGFVMKFPLQLNSLYSGTLLGGNGSDVAYAVATHPSDSTAYIAGWTDSTNFPTSVGAYRTTRQGPSCAFVTRMYDHMRLVYGSTYLGGTFSNDCAYAVAVDNAGNAFVAGRTWSADFPTYHPSGTPISTSRKGTTDGFVTRVAVAMNSIMASTYFGGNSDEAIYGMTLVQDAYLTNVFLAGFTDSATGFQATPNAFDTTHNGGKDGFAACINFDLTYCWGCTYLGGTSDEELYAVRYGRGSVFVAGYSQSGDYPVKEQSYEVINYGNKDAVLSRLSATMTVGTRRWIRTLDGSENASAPSISLAGAVYVSTMAGKLYSFDDDGYTNWLWWPVTLQNYTLPNAHPSVDFAGNVYAPLYGPTNALSAYRSDGYVLFDYLDGNSFGTRVTPAINSETNIFFGTFPNQKFVSLRAAGTVTNWEDTMPGNPSGSAALSTNGAVIIGTEKGVYSLNALTGATNWWQAGNTSSWEVGTNFMVDAPIALGKDGTVFFGTKEGSYGSRSNVFAALNMADGTLKWKQTIFGPLMSSPVVSSNDLVFFTVSNVLFRYTTAGAGGRIATFPLPAGTIITNRASPVLGANGSLFVGCSSNLYCLSGALTDGAPITTQWVFQTSVTGSISSAAIDTEGNIYFTCGNKLFSLYGAETLQMAPWPMANHDFMRSGNQGFVPLPLAPTWITATKGDFVNRIRIDWTNAPGAERYEVWRGTNSDVASITSRIAAVKTLYYFDSNVEQGKRYYYRVKGRNTFGISALSTAVDYGGTPPAAPASITATKGAYLDRIDVRWLKVPHADGYHLLRSETLDTNAAAVIAIQAPTNYTDTNIVRGLKYYYWARATNEFGISPFSPSDYGGTPPSEIAISASDGTSMDHIALSWTNLPGDITYQLWRNTSAAFGTATNIASLNNQYSWQDGGEEIIPWRTYYYWMRTTNEFGISAVGPMAQGRRALYAPSAIAASDGGAYTTKVNVVWPSSAFSTAYRLWRNTTADTNTATLLVLTGNIFYDDTGVTPGSTYYYWVQALNDYGVSAWTGPDSGGIPPAPPMALSATDGTYSNKITITWLGNPGSTGYALLRGASIDPTFATVIAELTGLSYDDTNVLPGAKYYYWARASSPYGNSRLSNSDAGWVALSPPTTIWASAGEYTNKVVVAWSAAAGASSYDIFRSVTDDPATSSRIAYTADTTYEDTGVRLGINYYYWVKAKTPVFISAFSPSAMGYASSGLADLRPSALVFLPSTIGLFSSPSAVSLRLQNLGPTPMSGANANVAFDFYLSANDTYGDADDIWLGSVNGTAVLNPGETCSIILSASERSALVIPYVDTGSYYVFAAARHRAPSSLRDPDPANSYTRRSGQISVKSFSLVTPSAFNDFSGDGKADFAVYSPDTGAWYIRSLEGAVLAWDERWGAAGMTPVMGDFDGDQIADLAVYDTATGNWYVRRLHGAVLKWAFNWGGPGFTPLACDFDGDAKADFAAYHPTTGAWFIKSGAGPILIWAAAWGGIEFSPVPGDYNGDGKADMGVYRPANWSWYVRTLDGAVIVNGDTWGGTTGFAAVPGDYDGDGTSDLAVYHEASGYWFIRTAAGALLAWGEYWGGPGLIPVPGDYNGDGKNDFAVYSPTTGAWFVRTLDGTVVAWDLRWGGPGFMPVGASE